MRSPRTLIRQFMEVAGKRLLGETYENLLAEAEAFRTAHRAAPHWFVVGMPGNMLEEMDARYMQLLQQRMGYDIIMGGHSGTALGYVQPGETDRLRSIGESRHMYRYDVLSWFGVWLWVNIAFGYKVEITAEDPKLDARVQRFMSNPKNASLLADDRIRDRFAKTTLVDGEIFTVMYVSTVDGECVVRLFPTEEIKGGPNGNGIIYKEGDRETILYYRREFVGGNGDMRVVYYPDYLAEEDDLQAAVLPDDGKKFEDTVGTISNLGGGTGPKTVAFVIHHTFDRQNDRGWPLLSPRQSPWSRAFRNFAQDRATIQRQAATNMEDITVDAGSRPISNIKAMQQSSLVTGSGPGWETNPSPTPGGFSLHNKTVKRERMSMNMAAGDAEHDALMLYRMASLGAGAYPHYMGVGDTTRLASTYSMELPQLREFNGFQLDWAAFFRKMVGLIARMGETHAGEVYLNHEVTVSLDSVIESDVSRLITSIGDFIAKSMQPVIATQPAAVASAVIIELWVLALRTLGVKDPEELIKNAQQAAAKEPVDGLEPDEEKTVDQIVDGLTPVIEALYKQKLGMKNGSHA